MGRKMRGFKTFALGLLLSLSFASLPLAMTGEAKSSPSGVSPAVAQAAAEQEVIARVTIAGEQDQQRLADTGVELLGSRLSNGSIFIRALLSRTKQLENEGWVIEVLYQRNGETWEYLGQPAGDCVYAISSTGRSFTYLAGTGSFNLLTDTDCEWTVLTTAPWITISGLQQGTGPVTISYSVAENTSSMNRVGQIFIQGNFYTIRQGVNFTDVPLDHPFFTEIGKISAHGITLGCGGTNYCPNLLVSREQMAAFISRALGVFNPPPPAMQRYADVPPENIFYSFIEEISVRGITLGCTPGNYCPGQTLTREQLAAFIIRALGEFNPPQPASQRFNDVPPSNPFYNFIDRMAALGITQGCSTNPPLYCPSGPVTRGMMAVFLVRAFNL